jgi:hypothetical protein
MMPVVEALQAQQQQVTGEVREMRLGLDMDRLAGEFPELAERETAERVVAAASE